MRMRITEGAMKGKERVFLSLALFMAVCGFDYKNLGDAFRQGKIRFVFLALIPVIYLGLKPRLTWAPAAFAALAWASFTLNDYMLYAELPVFEIMACLALAAAIVTIPAGAVAKTLIFAGSIQAVLGIFQYFGVHFILRPVFQQEFYEVVGMMGNRTVLGPFLCACLAPALWGKKYALSLIMIISIVCTKSSMTSASLGAVLSIYLWHRTSFKVAAAAASGALLILLGLFLARPDYNFFAGDGRGFIWSFGLRAFKAAPWFGGGIGSWAGQYIGMYKDEILKQFSYHLPFQMHNDYLDFLVEYGAVPFIGVLAAIAHFIKQFKPTWHHAVCASLMVNAAANFPLCLISHALIFVVCWAYSMRGDSHGMARHSLGCV